MVLYICIKLQIFWFIDMSTFLCVSAGFLPPLLKIKKFVPLNFISIQVLEITINEKPEFHQFLITHCQILKTLIPFLKYVSV